MVPEFPTSTMDAFRFGASSRYSQDGIITFGGGGIGYNGSFVGFRI